jgi:hypothetical protein
MNTRLPATASVAISAQNSIPEHIEHTCDSMTIMIWVDGHEEHFHVYEYAQHHAIIPDLPAGMADIHLSAERNTTTLWAVDLSQELVADKMNVITVEAGPGDLYVQQWHDDGVGVRLWYPDNAHNQWETVIPGSPPPDVLMHGPDGRPKITVTLPVHDGSQPGQQLLSEIVRGSDGFDRIIPNSFTTRATPYGKTAYVIEYITLVQSEPIRNQLFFLVHNDFRVCITFSAPDTQKWDIEFNPLFETIKDMIEFY